MSIRLLQANHLLTYRCINLLVFVCVCVCGYEICCKTSVGKWVVRPISLKGPNVGLFVIHSLVATRLFNYRREGKELLATFKAKLK
jgi:hypothetical protein